MTEPAHDQPPDWVYLASQSPRRRELLAQIGVRHELLLPGPTEDAEALEAELPGDTPHAYVERVTRAKLDAALLRRERRSLPIAPIVCADTTVALDGRLLGKPRDAADARATLTALAGRDHTVLTGVAIGWQGSVGWRLSVSRVWFAPLDADRIDCYIASGEPFGKAGAYAIQGRAAAWIARIDGSGSGIMGLPLCETAELLRATGMTV